MIDIFLKDLDLACPRHGHLDGRVQGRVGHRLQQVGDHAVLDSLVDEVGMPVGCEDDDRSAGVLGNLPRRGQPIHSWHFNIQEDGVGKWCRHISTARCPSFTTATTS